MKKILLIGPINKGNVPYTGDSAKNQFFYMRFREVFDKVLIVDTWAWTKRPWVLIDLLLKLIFRRGYKVVISANPGSADKIIRIAKLLGHTANIYYWVIGGSLHKTFENGLLDCTKYRDIAGVLVEGTTMVESMKKLGLTNVSFVPNFKKIEYIPRKRQNHDDKMHFVFLSRVDRAKGCDYILEAIDILNAKGLTNDFDVTFYGKSTEDKEWLDLFANTVSEIPNAEYKGLLDLRQMSNYDVLAGYDVMLFPTYWDGEGFPGVIIDAYMASLPVIASDWNLNKDLVHEGKTGWIIPVHNISALADKMEYVIKHPLEVNEYSLNCGAQAFEYDYRNVLSEENLRILKVLD